LERRGYLLRGQDGDYRLSLRLFELAHRHPPIRRLLAVSLPLMQELAQRSRQSAHLVVHYARRILVVAQVESPEPMGFSVRLGAHFPFRPDRASARVLSAFQAHEARDALIEEMIENSERRLSRRQLEAALEAIVERGHYRAPSDTMTAVHDLCCPIFDHSEAAVASLTVPYLGQRDVAVTVDEALELLVHASAAISAALGAPEREREGVREGVRERRP
ncbi:MAG: IclR family transcriptional regulator, partial [Gammaproteobacteria bacterium]